VKEAEALGHIERGVEQLFGAASHLTTAELTMVQAIWQSEDTVGRDAAWAKAKSHIRRTGRGRLLDAVNDRLAEWTNEAGGVQGYSRGITNEQYGGSGDTRRMTMSPLMDAAVAVIAADGLTDEERALLMRPLRSVAAKRGLRV
jgi:hypothetical protein